jgi:hypothetical protein
MGLVYNKSLDLGVEYNSLLLHLLQILVLFHLHGLKILEVWFNNLQFHLNINAITIIICVRYWF